MTGTGVGNDRGAMVVKVGGSLLSSPAVAPRVHAFCKSLDRERIFLIVGGGQLIDAVRRWDDIHALEPVANHWRCVDLLDATFAIAAEWFAFAKPAGDDCRVDQHGANIHLVRVASFYRPGQTFGLPCDWSTTTDAIAVALASHVGCGEATLLKSCDIPDTSLENMADLGLIDSATPAAARRLGVSVTVAPLC